MSMCSDEVFAQFDNDNKQFCEELLDWVMQESGVLRVNSVKHQKEGSGLALSENYLAPENYFIEDKIEYFLSISQKNHGVWSDFEARDIQMAFTMLDPYARFTLEQVRPGVFYTKFRTPQRLGIFKFEVEYAKHGLSFLHLDDKVSIIQWRHDMFPRFMHRIWPFYTSIFVLMAGFFVFLFYFLFAEEHIVASKKGK